MTERRAPSPQPSPAQRERENLSLLRVPGETCRDHARSSRLEWLETNGTGGYAMGTVAGTSTRRYHGLLVAPLRPFGGRHVLLARLEEAVVDGGQETSLATNQYPGTLHPEGHRHLTEFRLDPFPTWTHQAGGTVVFVGAATDQA